MVDNYKIINDPVHGFINVPSGLISRIIEHPWFQRLRDIKQLGLTNLVYPGAVHSRLSHALGAMHLMRESIAVLRKKGVEVTSHEEEAASAAMLLHDVGHGPFSHALENKIVCGVSHEDISLAMMERMNVEFGGALDMAVSIFHARYPKKFLHQLVSGQLDTDRLDYLKRDSFFSGVAEGMIGLERIIKMLTVRDNNLVVEEKGIYSVEKFLISRRLMYWQVYLHKTVVAAEQLIISIFSRARELGTNGYPLEGSPALRYFLSQNLTSQSFFKGDAIEMFTRLDDTDVMSAIKQWQFSDDSTLSMLCKMLTERKLPKIEFCKELPSKELVNFKTDELRSSLEGATGLDLSFFVKTGKVLNKGYDSGEGEILILSKDGMLNDVYGISDMLSARAFSQITKKYFLCTAVINKKEWK